MHACRSTLEDPTGATATATGNATNLSQPSCNTVAVTCDIVGSVDRANPPNPKTITATAQDTCEICSAQVDKEIKCGAGPFTDVQFVTNNEDGTDMCLGWNAFNGMPAEDLTFRYVIKNTGDTALFGCKVGDDNTEITTSPINIGDVSVGTDTTGNPADVTKPCSAALSLKEPDTATATCFCTADLNPNFVATATDKAKAQCETPGLTVVKKCLPQAAGSNEVDIDVMNTSTDATLANCVVTDTVFGNDTSCPPTHASTGTVTTSPAVPSPLAPGQMVTVKGSATGLTSDSCNVASVTCEIVGSVDPNDTTKQKKLTATSNDICEVPSCQVVKTCALQDANGDSKIDFTVTNKSASADLANCAITDTIFKSDPSCPPSGAGTPVTANPPIVPTGGTSLTPGNSTASMATVNGLTANACDQVSVTCDVVGSNGGTVTCTGDAVCVIPQVAGCRTTGGGITDACGPDLAGGDAPTHCKSTTDDALDATHGGQVGASVGVATAFTPDSACIKGEWTHVRHFQTNGNNNVIGNFHARSFDSLNCACLPCAGDPGSGTVVDGLCNPGDKVCGPEPRKAPDNAMCFSGVGDYTMTHGKRVGRSVVFRVDIQDHSEPGGSFPGGQTPPPDRYRFRLWFLNSASPTDPSVIALRQAVACAHAGVETVNAAAPDIDDGGDLLKGNRQIHPSLPNTDRCTP